MRKHNFAVAGLIGAVTLGLSSMAAQAGATWEWLKPEVFGERVVLDGSGVIEFSAPDRPEDQSHVPVSIKAKSRERFLKGVRGGAFVKEWSEEQARGSKKLAELLAKAHNGAMSQAERNLIPQIQAAHSLD